MIQTARNPQETPLNLGIYTLPEAARLVRTPQGTLARWLRGYRFPTKYSGGQSPPVFRAQLPVVEGHLALGFLDLVEALFIKAFREIGVSLPTIRRAAKRASELWGTDHPFCVRRLKTDGRSVFAELESLEGDDGLLDLAKSQYAFQKVLNPYLMQVDYEGVAETASRWWPLGKRKPVVLDPRYGFGRPVVSPWCVPTECLYQAVKADQSVQEVAWWFEIPSPAVRAAVEFEESLAA